MKRVLGIETEYGITIQGAESVDVVAESIELVRSYTEHGAHMKWDYGLEDPHRDARGFRAAELLLDTAMRSIAASGSTYATLGLSPLSHRAELEPLHQPFWLKFLLRWVKLYGARFYNFGGLDAFKAKFNPEAWEPIYAIAEGASFPPRALNAIAGAFSGGAPTRLVLRTLSRAARGELVSLRAKITSRNASKEAEGPTHERRA